MLSIEELKDGYFNIKDGDVKIKSSDLIEIFKYFEFMQNILANSLENLSEKEKDVLLDSINFYKYTKNKYIVLGDVRKKQRHWFEVLKKFENKDFTKDASTQEIEEVKDYVLSNYLQAKMDREKLQKEIEQMEKSLN